MVYTALVCSLCRLSVRSVPVCGWNGDGFRQRRCRATLDVTADPWIEILSPASQTGSGQVRFRGGRRTRAIPRTRGGVGDDQMQRLRRTNVWITQNPACRVRLESAPDSPAVFDSEGGIGHLLLRVDSVSCRWRSPARQIGFARAASISGTATCYPASTSSSARTRRGWSVWELSFWRDYLAGEAAVTQ
jgi:hypothetical protein